MEEVLIGLSPVYPAEEKELSLMLIMLKITPLHGKQFSEEFHRDRIWGPCLLRIIPVNDLPKTH